MTLDYGQDIFYLGSRIRDERESRGMSQEVMADATGVSVSTLYRFENGVRVLPVDLLLRIADVLDVSVLTLLPPRFELQDKCHRYANKNPKEIQLEQAVLRLKPRDKKVVYNTVLALVESLLG